MRAATDELLRVRHTAAGPADTFHPLLVLLQDEEERVASLTAITRNVVAAVRHIQMDTAEDRAAHERLLAIADRALAAVEAHDRLKLDAGEQFTLYGYSYVEGNPA